MYFPKFLRNPQVFLNFPKVGGKLGKTWEKEEAALCSENILSEGIYNTEII